MYSSFIFINMLMIVKLIYTQDTTIFSWEYTCCGDYCYYLSNKTATWEDAYFECKESNQNLNLAILDNKEKDKTIRNCLNKNSLAAKEIWIGAMYNWVQLRWVWRKTGKKIMYQAFSQKRNEDDSIWKCAVLNPKLFYRWSARDCFSEKHYICEFSA